MDDKDAKRYLNPHSIQGARATTINGAFAALVVPHERFDKARVLEALAFLGQPEPEGALLCVYCGREPARTWDHMVPVVMKKRPQGPGHQLGNLVPACKACNSAKGNRDWRAFVADHGGAPDLGGRLQAYADRFLTHPPFDADDPAPELRRLDALRERILEMLHEADDLAAALNARRARAATPPAPGS